MTSYGEPADASVSVALGRAQRSALRALLGSVEEVGDPEDDAAARRLYPPASSHEDVAAEFADMTRDDLRSLHQADEAVLDDVLGRGNDDVVTMSTTEANACLRAVAAARIALAARFGMFEDEPRRVGFRQRAAVDFIGYVQEQMVHALMTYPDQGQTGRTEGRG